MATQLRWIWAWLASSRRDVVAIVLLIVFLGIVTFAYFVWPPGMAPVSELGADWNCTHVGYGDPVCVKKPSAIARDAAPATR
jgi:hypothetical protein